MLEALTSHIQVTIQNNAWLAPVAALLGGMTTAANPCVLAMVPLMIGFVAGRSETRSVRRAFALSLAFVAGLTITFLLLFMGTWAVTEAGSKVLKDVSWIYVTAAICLLMGLHLLGVLDFRIPAPSAITPTRQGFIGAFLLGLLFGLVSLPCAGPILIVLLSVVPTKGPLFGGMLLVMYSLGHCALILVGGTSMGWAQRMIDSKGLKQANLWLKRTGGAVIIAVGVYLLII